MELLQEGIGWIGITLLGCLVYLIPGWAFLEYLWPERSPLRWPEKLGLGTGLSLAVYPILLLAASLVGIRLGAGLALIPILLGLCGLAWKFRGIRISKIRSHFHHWRAGEWLLPDLALLGLTLLLLIGRFYAVRGLEAPMWGDSYQHSVITRLLIENGGLFTSWEPYAPLQSFTYHFGFHAQVAALEWLAGVDASQAVLVGGQLINCLAVLGLIPLALRTGRNRWAGVFAVLIAGLLVPMPMAYTNWGRYTQLAGQAILPAAVLISWVVLDAERTYWKTIVLGWITLGGLALTHYRVILIAVVFFLAYLLIRIWRPGRLALLGRIAILGIGSLAIFSPWLAKLLNGPLVDLVSSQLSTPPASDSVWHLYNALDLANLKNFLPTIFWILMIFFALLGIIRRKRGYLLISLWWLLIVIGTNPNWIYLPGVGLMSNFAIAIAAYIPAGILIGGGAGDLLESALLRLSGPPENQNSAAVRPIRRRAGWGEPAVVLAIFALGLIGGIARHGDIDPGTHALVTREDRVAMDWIRDNLPEDAKFHVNQFFAFAGSVTVGSDGGWWLPLLAGRSTDLPPINYGFETGPRPDFREWTNALPALIIEKGIDSPEVLMEFKERGLNHIYLGQRQGRVNHDGSQAIDPAELIRSPNYDLIYQTDQVMVFKINS